MVPGSTRWLGPYCLKLKMSSKGIIKTNDTPTWDSEDCVKQTVFEVIAITHTCYVCYLHVLSSVPGISSTCNSGTSYINVY